MAEDKVCKKCKVDMELVRKEEVKGTKYQILKCDKCKCQIARAEN